MYVSIRLKRLVAVHNAEAQVRARVRLYRVYCDQIRTGTGFSPNSSIFLSIIPPLLFTLLYPRVYEQ
jgi:hypothetical protein